MSTDRQELRAKAEAAPQDEWKVETDGDVTDVDYGRLIEWPWRIEGVCNFTEEFKESIPHEPIAEFIATFDPPTVLSLLDALEQAETELSSLRERRSDVIELCQGILNEWHEEQSPAMEGIAYLSADVVSRLTGKRNAATLLDPSPPESNQP